jgi:hypothetical protein
MIEEHRDVSPSAIGSLSTHEEMLEAYVFVPAERMAALVALAHSGRVRVASIDGTKLHYRSGKDHSISLNTTFDPDEY